MAKFKFKKKYGQNFLQDTHTIEKIVDSINPTTDDLIIEIGPGAGAITKSLKKFNAKIIAFEIDDETKKYLLPLEDEKTKIIYADFLYSDIAKILKNYENCRIFFIGNLPYYITTPIIEHIIDSGISHESLTVMVQREVADRFLAKPGHKEYGYMTVLLNFNYDISKVIDVDRKKFYPVPNVDSTVLKLTSKKKIDGDYEKLKKLLKDSFQFKRKTLKNNLNNYDTAKIEKILNEDGYSLSNRAEEIPLDVYIKIWKNI